MKRDDPDAFSPHTEKWLSLAGDGSAGPLPRWPTGAWSSRGVIDALEPLLTDERRDRLREVVQNRLGSVTLVLDNPHDPHNGSAIIRSCDAFGVQNLHVLCERQPFLASRNVAKGAHRWVDVFEHEHPEDLVHRLKQDGFQVVVTHPRGRLSTGDLGGIARVALVLGNEHEGVSQALTDAADDAVRVDMRGFVESLNVSVSAAVCLHAATHHRPGDLSPEARDEVYARWLRTSVPRADEVLAALPAH